MTNWSKVSLGLGSGPPGRRAERDGGVPRARPRARRAEGEKLGPARREACPRGLARAVAQPPRPGARPRPARSTTPRPRTLSDAGLEDAPEAVAHPSAGLRGNLDEQPAVRAREPVGTRARCGRSALRRRSRARLARVTICAPTRRSRQQSTCSSQGESDGNSGRGARGGPGSATIANARGALRRLPAFGGKNPRRPRSYTSARAAPGVSMLAWADAQGTRRTTEN